MIKIIVNPTAGGGRAVDHASTLARACADAGMSVHVHVASNRDDTVRTAMETASRGLVIACGGDGTVHDCLQGVMRADVASPRLAIWPVGTGNDIDRGLHLTNAGTDSTDADAQGQPETLVSPSEVFPTRLPMSDIARLTWARCSAGTVNLIISLGFSRAGLTRMSTSAPMPCRREWERLDTCWASPGNCRLFAPVGTPSIAMVMIAAWRAWC